MPDYDRRSGEIWVLEEVLNSSTRRDAQAFLQDFIGKSQEIHKRVSEAFKKSQSAVEGGDKVTGRDLEQAVYHAVVQPVWGDDAMGKLLAKVIAHGDFVY